MTYTSHFKLKERPFSHHPDPRFFYLTDQHQNAKDKSEYVAHNRLGLGVTYGTPGTGKTSLARILFQRFSDAHDFKTVMLANPDYPTDNRLLRAVIHEFDVGKTQKAMDDSLRIFQDFLEKKIAKEGKTALLIVDHGERMDESLYALIHDLIELRDQKQAKGLLQVLIFGRHDVLDKMRDPRSKFLQEKVVASASLENLSFEEMRRALHFRFHIAGRDDPPFTDHALQELYVLSKGNPRVVSKLADQSLLEAVLGQWESVEPELVRQAWDKLGADFESLILQEGEELPEPKSKRGRPALLPRELRDKAFRAAPKPGSKQPGRKKGTTKEVIEARRKTE
jgi:general secretion pathway protein A